MKGNEWISTVESLKQANKEKDEFINSLMADIERYKKEILRLRPQLAELYERAGRLQDKYIKARNATL